MKKKGVMLGFFILISLIIFSSSFGFVSAWTNTGGGDHSGQNWIISSNTFVAGVHTNVGNFTIPSGIIVSVKPYDGTTYGSFEVHASNITVAGTLNASGAGYGGGGGGGGGASGCNCVISGSSSGGYGFADGSNGNSGGGSRFQQGCSENGNTNICGGATAGAGGAGGGPSGGFGGAGGTPKNNCITTNANSPWYGSLGGDGSSGRYCNTSSSNITSLCDSSSDETLRMGSGGGGAGGGGGGQTWSGNIYSGGGGGAGNAGGGIIKLYADNNISVIGNIYSFGNNAGSGNGATGRNGNLESGGQYQSRPGGAGGNASYSGSSSGGYGQGSGGSGGPGAGGGILLKAQVVKITGTINNAGRTTSAKDYGGTFKVFTCPNEFNLALSGTNYVQTGRNYTSTFTCTAPVVPTIVSSSWNASAITLIDSVKLTAVGSDLSGNFKFDIFNLEKTLINTNTLQAFNSTQANMTWSPTTIGTYFFNVTLISSGQVLTSGQLIVSLATRTQNCDLSSVDNSLPANAVWNDYSNGVFTQTYDSSNVWTPTTYSANYNLTQGICNFKCKNSSYEWNGSACNLVQKYINFCWDLTTQKSCEDASQKIAKNSIGGVLGSYCGKTDIKLDNCYYSASCSCVWIINESNSNGGTCTNESIYYTKNSGQTSCSAENFLCKISSNVDNSGCSSNLDTITVNQNALWSGSSSIAEQAACKTSTQTFACPASYKLSFSSDIGLILLVLVIIFIYIFALKKKNKVSEEILKIGHLKKIKKK